MSTRDSTDWEVGGFSSLLCPPGRSPARGVGDCSAGLCPPGSSTAQGMQSSTGLCPPGGSRTGGIGVSNTELYYRGGRTIQVVGGLQYWFVSTRQQHCPGGEGAVLVCIHQGAALPRRWAAEVLGCVHQEAVLPRGSRVCALRGGVHRGAALPVW